MSKIVSIGDFRIKRERESFITPAGKCSHFNLVLDDNGHLVLCEDCNTYISPYWVLLLFREHYRKAMDSLKNSRKQLADEQAKSLHLLAARKIEKIWRGRKRVPCCPHCGEGIFPEDNLGGQQIDRAIAMSRREKSQ